MTGTGTAADPYVVDNWADFVTAVTQSGVYVTCPENLTWDMNEIAPTGITSHIYFKCAEFNGNNLTIRNLYIPTNGAEEFIYGYGTIKNVNFINMDIRVGNFFNHYSAALKFYSCRFSGILTNAFFYDVKGSYTDYMYECSFNLKFNGKSSFRYSGTSYVCRMYNCNVKLDYSGVTDSGELNIRMSNCLLTGNISSISSIRVQYTENVVIDADIAVNMEYTNTYTSSNVLVNSDRIADGITINEIYTLVTTAQLQDAEYLSSIGFPIGVD